MAERRVVIKLTLACGHTAEALLPIPELGATFYCHTCGDWSEVTEVPDRWEVRCLARRTCLRVLRHSEGNALRTATSHAKSTRHKIQVRHGGLAVHQWEQSEGWYQPWHPSLPTPRNR